MSAGATRRSNTKMKTKHTDMPSSARRTRISSSASRESSAITNPDNGLYPPQGKHPYQIGKTYLVQTVTHYYTGRLENVYKQELVLARAAWVANTGRFADSVKNASFVDVEFYPPRAFVIVGRGSIVSAVRIPKLPKNQRG